VHAGTWPTTAWVSSSATRRCPHPASAPSSQATSHVRSLSPSGRSQARELGRAQCCTTPLRPPAHCITARTLQKLQEAVEAVEGRLRLGVARTRRHATNLRDRRDEPRAQDRGRGACGPALPGETRVTALQWWTVHCESTESTHSTVEDTHVLITSPLSVALLERGCRASVRGAECRVSTKHHIAECLTFRRLDDANCSQC
jgi:hypothetical protein